MPNKDEGITRIVQQEYNAEHRGVWNTLELPFKRTDNDWNNPKATMFAAMYSEGEIL